ncbi:MAG: PepSY-associated TM helix domain-containing protein [Myxococcota bacterium]
MTDAAKKEQHTPRRKLFFLHSWVGFNFALFMMLVVMTGTFAVIADEIDWLIHPELRVEVGTEKVSWGTMARAVREYAPHDAMTMLSAGEGDYFAHRATMTDTTGRRYYLYVDPWTGEVTGTTSALTVQRFLRDLHRYLFMPSAIGLPLVSTLAVVLIISLYTGLKTARRWWRSATRIRLNRGIRIFMGDSHRAVGLWAVWFIALVAVTGLWYFAELAFAIGGTRFEPPRPGIDAERVETLAPVSPHADPDALIASVHEVFPELEPVEIQFAYGMTLASTVLGFTDDPLVRKRANRVFLDPFDASVIKVQRSPSLGWVAYLNEIADPLHFGFFGGLTTKIIWFVFGLGLLTLSFSGVWLTWRRVKSRSPSTYQLATLPLFAIVAVVGSFYVARFLPEEVTLKEQLPVTSNAPMQTQLFVVTDDGTPTGEFRIVLRSNEGRINLQTAEVTIGADRQVLEPSLLGRHVTLTGELPEGTSGAPAVVVATFRFPGGQTFESRWRLSNDSAHARHHVIEYAARAPRRRDRLAPRLETDLPRLVMAGSANGSGAR